MDNFEKASRLQLRFNTPKGVLVTEDLWVLPLTASAGSVSLNSVAVGLFKQLKESEEISFVDAASNKDEVTQLKLDIVRHVIAVRQAEKSERLKKAESDARRQKILAIVAEKQDDALKSMPLDELKKLLED